MYYSNLLKGLAIIAMVVGLSSCGGVKTKEVNLNDCVKIQKQKITFQVTEEVYDGEKDVYLDSYVKVEALADVKEGKDRIRMRLFDKDDTELIYLVGRVPESKGTKERVEFGLTWGNDGKTKESLEEIVAETKKVTFELF